MRKYQQKLILDLLKQCEYKHNDIRYLPADRLEDIIGGLDMCQKYAVQAGEFIEHIYGEGSRTVALLEEYYELLYSQISSDSRIQVKTLNRQLFKVINSVNSELKADKIEVAFFPYKVSMSDSLESIYLAAKADPQCDAYWVPVPYYDKAEDGSFGEMHYEGGKYPAYLEPVDWRTYDTKARHPDIIFIHYPYDGCNYVTSLDPDYYSGVLKDQTDFLVYVDYGIPYWVQKRPFIRADAVPYPFMTNIDLYVAYSREVAESLKVVLLQSRTTKGMYSKSKVNEKVISLGSPKFDKVLSAKRENCRLPKEWKTCIGNRKILLFNTSLGSLLKNNEQFLAEIRRVIETVCVHDDIILWWRPHPLILETINSMCPQLSAEYCSIVKDFKNNKQGIYDDTEELYRAITWSDGCLTDESSLMYLYLATGRPFSVTAPYKRLPSPLRVEINTFTEPLRRRIENMKAAKGANIRDWNCCIWWDNFLEEDISRNIHYDNFLECFIHYLVHKDEYLEAEEYRQLQLQMFKDFVENPDGTAGQKIYEYCRQKITEVYL